MSGDAETSAETRKAEIEADIIATRAELAETADALAAKLDVKAQATHKAHEAGDKVTEKYTEIKEKAPEPVQKVIGKTEQAVSPLLAQAAADKRRTMFVLGGVAVLVVVLRRVRARGRG